MAAHIDAPKANPADVAALALDGIETDLTEILADDITRNVKQGLSASPAVDHLSPEREAIVAEKEECADATGSFDWPLSGGGRDGGMFALVPYLSLSAALQPLSPIIARDLHMSLQAMNLTLGMANAAYAIGTVFAVQFALRLPQRRMLLVYGVLLVVGSVLAASATASGVFIVGHVLQGLCTSLLLIAALPPLIIGYPVDARRAGRRSS